MRAERIVGCDRFGHQIRALRLDTGIDVLAVIAVGPAVKSSILHRGHVIGHEVVAEFVALVDHDPQRAALRLPGRTVRVAQARSEHTRFAGGAVDFEYGGAIGLVVDAVFADIAVGADRGIKLRPIRARGQILGPVVVERASGQVRDLDTGGCNPGVAAAIREFDDRIGIGDVKIIAD